MFEQKFKTWDRIAECMYESFELSKYVNSDDMKKDGYNPDWYIYIQFTGLYDVNEKEIYCGDVLKYVNKNSGNEKIKGYVVFEKGAFRLKHIDKDIAVDCVNLSSLGGLNKYFEVVGNIYQNSELIDIK